MLYAQLSRPFVGRAPELATLADGLAHAAAGGPALALIGGEAGVGKTRLVGEFAERASAGGALVVSGGCVDLPEGTVPYAPALEGLRALVRAEGPERIVALAGTDIGRLLPVELHAAPATGPVDAGAQGRTFAAFARLLEALGDAAPVVLVFEDLHWADSGTCDLLAYLGRRLRDARVLLVVTFRAGEPRPHHPLGPLLAELGRLDGARRVELARFDRDELAQLVHGVLGTTPEPGLLTAVFERSGGNAYFAEALAGAGEQLPTALRELLLAGLAGLSPAARHVLELLAVAGGRADYRLLARASDLRERDLVAALQQAAARQAIVRDGDGTGYMFWHALGREAVMSALLAGERRMAHEAIARALEAEHDLGGPAQRALHWRGAGDASQELRAGVGAGRAADALCAFDDAAGHYGRALEAWSRAVRPEQEISRAELLELAAEATLKAARREDAAGLFAALIAALDAEAEPVRVALVLTRRSHCLWQLGREHEAFAASTEAIRLVRGQPPSEGTARVAAHLALRLSLSGRQIEAIAAARDAIARAQASGADVVEAAVRIDLGGSLVAVGQVEDGIAELRLALRMAREHERPEEIARAYVFLSDALLLAGALEEAVSTATEGAEVAERLGLGAGLGAASRANAIEALVALGRHPEALAGAESVIAAAAPGAPRVLGHQHAAAVSILMGDLAAAERHIAAARASAGDVAMLTTAIELLDAEFALANDDPETALASLTAAGLEWETLLARSVSLEIRACADLASRARARRDLAVAEDAATRAAARFDELERARRLAQAAPPLPEVELLGRLAAAELSRAQGASAVDAWHATATTADRQRRAFPAAYARRRAAEASLAVGDRASATTDLRVAGASAMAMAATPLRVEIEVLARRARISLVDDAPPELVAGAHSPARQLGLTPREIDVLRELAEGRSNPQIAARLFISTKTASLHVSHILAKLGVSNRLQAALAGEHLGILDSDEPAQQAVRHSDEARERP
jgi:DNA-binding NarL/FixJ family response regulator/tetratricopeptide (TPR) repeat protein